MTQAPDRHARALIIIRVTITNLCRNFSQLDCFDDVVICCCCGGERSPSFISASDTGNDVRFESFLAGLRHDRRTRSDAQINVGLFCCFCLWLPCLLHAASLPPCDRMTLCTYVCYVARPSSTATCGITDLIREQQHLQDRCPAQQLHGWL